MIDTEDLQTIEMEVRRHPDNYEDYGRFVDKTLDKEMGLEEEEE